MSLAGAAPVRRRTRSALRRDHHVHLRLTAAELDTLAIAARAEGITVAGYVATAALQLAAGDRTPIPTATSEQWQALVAARLEAQRIRHHLGDLAAHLASTGQPAPDQLAALIAAAAVAVTRLDRAAISFQPKRKPRK